MFQYQQFHKFSLIPEDKCTKKKPQLTLKKMQNCILIDQKQGENIASWMCREVGSVKSGYRRLGWQGSVLSSFYRILAKFLHTERQE